MKLLRIAKYCAALLAFVALFGAATAQDAQTDELKARANELFEAGDYAGAKPLYSQLLSLYAKDPTYNYRFGACLLLVDRDKETPFDYIKFALGRASVDPEAYYFLGLAHHMRYEFHQATAAYNEFKSKATSKQQERYSVEQNLRQCENGKLLLRDITDLLVLQKSDVGRENYFRAYDIASYGGKLITKPDEFVMQADKRYSDETVLYLNRDSDTLYFSSYGKKGSNGRDIYYSVKTAEGGFGEPKLVAGGINTPYDEDFPFLAPDKRTLYFASNGHNSMGGYDIFKSTLDPATGKFSAPQNLDYAINTPDDDFLYVTDGKSAWFSSNRETDISQVTIYKVRTERVPLDISVIKGKFKSDKSTKARIIVRDLSTGEEVGVFETDPETGEYTIPIEKGGRYQFVVEPDQDTALYENEVRIPKFSGVKRWGQEINFDETADGGRLTINANFSEELPADPNDLLLASEILRKKATLEVNYSEEEAAAADAAALADAETNPVGNTPNENDPQGPPTNDGLMPWERDSLARVESDTVLAIEQEITNQDIIRVAREDAEEAQKEADELAIQAKVAYNLANQKNEQAVLQANEADEAMQLAKVIDDDAAREDATAQALEQQKEARQLSNEAIIAYSLAKTIDAKAEARQGEADRAAQYATEIEAAITASDPEKSIELLNELKASLETSNQQGDAQAELTRLKKRTEAKRTEASDQAAYAQSLKNQERSLQTQLNAIDSRLEETRDASERASLEQQKESLQAEQTQLREQFATEFEKARDLNTELAALEREQELLTNVVDYVRETARVGKEEVAEVSDTDKQRLSQEFDGKQLDIEEEVSEAVTAAMAQVEQGSGGDELASTGPAETETETETSTETEIASTNPEQETEFVDPAISTEVTETNEPTETTQPETPPVDSETEQHDEPDNVVAVVSTEPTEATQPSATFEMPEGGAEELESLPPRSESEYAAITDKQNKAADLRSKAAELRANAEYLKKKKDREALLASADRMDAEADALEAEATLMIDEVLLIETAEASVTQRAPGQAAESENVFAEASDFDAEALALEEEAATLREQAQQAGSKSEQQAIQQQADEREALAEESRSQAQDKRALAQRMQAAEQQAMAKAAAASIDDEEPLNVVELSAEEAETVAASPAFTNYVDAKAAYRTEMAAFAEAAEAADRKRKEAKNLDETFTSLMAQAEATTDPAQKQQLQADAEAARAQSAAANAEADVLVAQAQERQQRATNARASALDMLLDLPQDNYLQVLAAESQQLETGILKYAEFADADETAALLAEASLPAGAQTSAETPINAQLADATNPASSDSADGANPTETADPTSTEPLAAEQPDVTEPATNPANGQAPETATGQETATNQSDTSSTNQSVVAGDPLTEAENPATSDTVSTAALNPSTESTAEAQPAVAEQPVAGTFPQPVDAPAISFAPSTQTAAEEVPTFTATATNGGELTWYADPDLTQPVGSGETFQPTDATPTQPYYVTETVDGEETAPATISIEILENNEAAVLAAQAEGSSPADGLPTDTNPAAAQPETSAPANTASLATAKYASPAVQAADESFLEMKAQPAVSAEANEEKEKIEAEVDALHAEATDFRERAILADNKKDKRDFEARAAELEAEAQANEAELREVRLTAVTLREAEEAISSRPLDQPRESELLSQRAAEAREEAQGLRYDAAVLRETAATKKKGERATLEQKADDLDNRAVLLDQDAVTYDKLTQQTREAESAAIRKAIVEGMDAEAPLLQKNLTPAQEQEVVENEAFATYMSNKTDYRKSVRKAEVLYAEAKKTDTTAVQLAEEAKKLEFDMGMYPSDSQEYAETRAKLNYVQQQQERAETRSDSLRGEAKKVEGQAILARGRALDAVLEQDEETAVNMIAYEHKIAEAAALAEANPAASVEQPGDTEEASLAEAGVVPAGEETGTQPTQTEPITSETVPTQALTTSTEQPAAEADPVDQAEPAQATEGDIQPNAVAVETAQPVESATEPAQPEAQPEATQPETQPVATQPEATQPVATSTESVTTETATEQPTLSANQPVTTTDTRREEPIANIPSRTGNVSSGTGIDAIPVSLNQPIYAPLAQTESRYSEAKPIPIDPELPEGLIFKVQVGAFRNAIPQDLFRGFAPVHGERTDNGLTRYTAGLFNDLDAADNAKDQIRAIGYNDAFVVAFLDGERIPLYQALALRNSGDAPAVVSGTGDGPIRVESPGSTGSATTVVDVRPASEASALPATSDNPVLTEVETVKGLFYTVQIGVYRSEVPASTLYNISPINSERTGNGNVRYTSGIYSDVPTATTARDRIRAIGISDAFVTAYYNGKRITVAEARSLLAQQGSGILATGGAAPSPAATTPSAQPTSSEGIQYRVFLGKYNGQVPVEEAQVILSLGAQGVKVSKEGTQTVYECGEFSNFSAAETLLQSVDNQLPQAKVVAFQNGNPIDVEAAKRLTN